MIREDLLSIVQPSSGWFAVLGIKGKDVRQEFAETREEVDVIAEKFVSQKRDAYFGVAKFKTSKNRHKDNVQGLQSFWLDIDCGKSKAKVNPKTNRPDGYIDQEAGIKELQRFCKLIGLPKPVIVNSGRGIHVYWPLTNEITRAEWEPVAERLRELCVTHDFHIDGKVFEVARVLRIPGTYNFKDEPPGLVEVLNYAPAIEYEVLKKLLGVKKLVEIPPKRELTELAKSMLDSSVASFSKIMVRSANGTGCAQLLDCYENRATLSEPRWFDALSIAKFCIDKNTAIHKLSEGYHDYDPIVTEQKVEHIGGAHSCIEFEKSNPGGCDGCPHKGRIKTPIQLGKEILEATKEDNNVEDEEGDEYTIPKYPYPFFRGKTGGIFLTPLKDELDPILVYEHDLYVVKRMKDPILGDVIVLRVHMPKDGVKEFVVSNVTVIDGNELHKSLASFGIMPSANKAKHLSEFIRASIRELQFKKRAEHMRLQFGWADDESKFIIGDREITRDGVFHSPPSNATKEMAAHLQPAGTFEKWKEVFALYGKPGLEGHAFATLTAFGSPLLRFFNLNGAIINIIHPSSGTGKSTILHMCNSVYGNPEKMGSMWRDTLNAKTMRLGILNNLPNTVDEMTNMSANDFSTLAYNMSQGRGRDRVKASANEMRLNLTTWQSISLASSNASFYEKISAAKSSADGEMMRLLEFNIDYNNVLDMSFAKQMFDHQLKENYGHAGGIYAEWLVNNLEEAKNTALTVQEKIDRELKLSQKERFWSAILAANITGGLIAKNIGLIDWDMKAIYKWATTMLSSIRAEVSPEASNPVGIVGDYINRHMQNILVVNNNVDLRTKLPTFPVVEPKGELLIRYEPDTKKMFIASKQFKNDCIKLQINYKLTYESLKRLGVLIEHKNPKRLSKGMKVVAPGVSVLMFDCEHPDFANMSSIVVPKPDEDNNVSGAS